MDRVHPRVTIRHVAEKAGCHFTTAARALKRDPRITLATRRKVEAAAKALGYMADPMMAAFSAYRQKRRMRDFQGTLAWIQAQGNYWRSLF